MIQRKGGPNGHFPQTPFQMLRSTNLVSLLLVAIILRVLINSYDKQDMVEVIQSD